MGFRKIWIPLIIVGIIAASTYYVSTLRPKTQSAAQTDTTSSSSTTSRTSSASPERLMARAGWLTLEGRKEEAKVIYRKIMEENSQMLMSRIAEARLLEEGFDIFFGSLDETNSEVYVVRSGDNLGRIAKKYGITPGLIRLANGVKGNNIRPYQELKIMKDPLRILVDKSTNILILKAGDRVIKTYPVGTGKGGGTPVGEFKIINRLKDPTAPSEIGQAPNPKN